jgi:hypothetical protein
MYDGTRCRSNWATSSSCCPPIDRLDQGEAVDAGVDRVVQAAQPLLGVGHGLVRRCGPSGVGSRGVGVEQRRTVSSRGSGANRPVGARNSPHAGGRGRC